MARQSTSAKPVKAGARRSHKKVPSFCADFETTTTEDDCRVWSWGIIQVGKLQNYIDGISLDGFMSHISERAAHIYFHNLAFDGTFILDWLLKHDYRWVKENPGVKEFTSLISRMGKYYSITVVFETGYRVEFRDSFKKLPMSGLVANFPYKLFKCNLAICLSPPVLFFLISMK